MKLQHLAGLNILFMLLFLFDLSIMQAYPITSAFALSANLEHSKLDLPVVITSSTIKIFCPFLISNPLLKSNPSLLLSAKIVSEIIPDIKSDT